MPEQIYIIPDVQTVGPGKEIFVQIWYTDPPFYLSKETPIAQAFLLPRDNSE